MSIFHLVYVSTAARKFSEAELANILNASRRNNSTLDITGMLIYADGNFIQAIEGPETAVEGLYRKIVRDPRHHDVRRVFSFSDDDRDFGDWTMGLSRGPVSEELRQHLGLVAGHRALEERLAAARPTLRLLRGFAERAA